VPEQDLFGDVPAPVQRPRQTRKPAPQPLNTWFFALRPIAEDAMRIQAFAEGLLASQGVMGKRIGAERLHITLELVGHDVEPGIVEAACRAGDALRHSAIDVCFDAAMSFSAPSGPFVLLGDIGLEAVRHLRTSLACAMADQGFTAVRSYEPHMTLAYDPRNRLPRFPIQPIGFHAAEIALVKSHIGFSRHEVLRTWPLVE
jgi:RNA 2',3'-cyclic 3'-phosphodiesterase